MNKHLKKAKLVVRRYAPAIVSTAVVTTIVTLAVTRKSDTEWVAYVLNKEQLDAFAENPATCVVFEDTRAFVTGRI